MNTLPKLYRVVVIEFGSLRGSLGDSLGYVEVDYVVKRKARRVICDDGWKWQLADASEWYDVLNDIDSECLNENKLDFKWIK